MVILMMNMTINTMNWGNSASPRVDANSFDLFRGYHPETINYDKFILKWGCSLLFVNWWLVHPGVTFGYLHFMQEITIKPPFNPYSWAIATKKKTLGKKGSCRIPIWNSVVNSILGLHAVSGKCPSLNCQVASRQLQRLSPPPAPSSSQLPWAARPLDPGKGWRAGAELSSRGIDIYSWDDYSQYKEK